MGDVWLYVDELLNEEYLVYLKKLITLAVGSNFSNKDKISNRPERIRGKEDMGNCLKSPTSDDISLLHESQSDRASFGDGADPDLEPPPPYQVSDRHQNFQWID